MVRHSGILGWTLVALCALAACNGSDSVTSAPSGSLTLALEEVAVESDSMTEEIIETELSAMGVVRAPVVETRTFMRTRSCPGGGEFTVEGSITRTADPATGVMEAEIEGSRSRVDCVFSVDGNTITVNGSSSWEKFRRRVNGVPDGPQTSHYAGSWLAVSSNGEERSCTFDVTVIRDPETRTRTVEGTFCNDRFRHRRNWDSGA